MRSRTACLALILSVGLPACAYAGNPGDLVPGMSEAQVVELVGPPDAVRLERNGVVCLTYGSREHVVLARLFGKRTGVVALKDNRLVNYETIHTGNIRFHCSHVAAKWDPPMGPPLVCDDRWGPRCQR
jgi:hypothetical protein